MCQIFCKYFIHKQKKKFMHVEILIECSFTSEELLRIICKCCEIAHEQVRISELKCRFNRIDRIAHEQIKISKFIYRFDRI